MSTSVKKWNTVLTASECGPVRSARKHWQTTRGYVPDDISDLAAKCDSQGVRGGRRKTRKGTRKPRKSRNARKSRKTRAHKRS
jgi:hypothetical protein